MCSCSDLRQGSPSCQRHCGGRKNSRLGSDTRRGRSCRGSAKFLVFTAKFLVFDTQFLAFNTKFIIFTHRVHRKQAGPDRQTQAISHAISHAISQRNPRKASCGGACLCCCGRRARAEPLFAIVSLQNSSFLTHNFSFLMQNFSFLIQNSS